MGSSGRRRGGKEDIIHHKRITRRIDGLKGFEEGDDEDLRCAAHGGCCSCCCCCCCCCCSSSRSSRVWAGLAEAYVMCVLLPRGETPSSLSVQNMGNPLEIETP